MNSIFKNIVQTNLLIAVTGVLITLPALAAKMTESASDGNGRIPTKIVQTGSANHVFTGESLSGATAAGPFSYPHAYGHFTQYNLQIRTADGKPYDWGRAKEGFMNINPQGSNPNPAEPNGHKWEKGANIVDTNGEVRTTDPNYAANQFMNSFDQIWACYVGIKRYPLNMHQVANYWHYSTRNGGS